MGSSTQQSETRVRIYKILCALDHLCFSIATLGNCYYYEMASSAAYRLELAGRWQGKVFRPFIDWLFFLSGKEHCKRSWQWQENIYKQK